MSIKYYLDENLTSRINEIVNVLGMNHVDTLRVVAMCSKGSGARRTLARCYALSKIWQLALDTKAHYIIEVISEKFDRLSKDEQDKVLIHELAHIPFSFGGGFKHHGNWVTRDRVEMLYRAYKQLSQK
jgi:predicted metallopeptidase